MADNAACGLASTASLQSQSLSSINFPRVRSATSCASIPVFNILVFGKVGVGKARLINEMFGRTIFATGAVTEVVKGVSQREEMFVEGGVKYRIKIFDTLSIRRRGPQIKRSKMMAEVRDYVDSLYPNGIHTVLLVYRHEDRNTAERKRFLYILHRLNEDRVPLNTALVITGCANKNDSARKKIISEFDANPATQGIGRYVLQGMYAVGFTDLSTVPDAMAEMYRAVNSRDAMQLRDVLERCYTRQLTSDLFFYRGRFYKGFCEFPWQYCPCYDRIYTCWRWGFSWEDCLRVEQRDSF